MPLRDDHSQYANLIMRVRFGDTVISCRPALLEANPAYAKALMDFRCHSPYRLAITAAEKMDPRDVREETEELARREFAEIYADTVVVDWEGPGADDPAVWLSEHPEDFHALVIFCQDPEEARRAAKGGTAG